MCHRRGPVCSGGGGDFCDSVRCCLCWWMRGCGGLPLRQRGFDLANQLVRFLLSHLPATYHILYEIACALDHESTESGSGIDDILHRGCHFASGLEADLVGFGRHFGDSVFYVGSTMAWTAPWRDRRSYRRCWSSSGGSWLGRFLGLSHYMLLMVCGRANQPLMTPFGYSGTPAGHWGWERR